MTRRQGGLPQHAITEKEFQRQVLDVAIQYGWHVPAKDMRPWEDDPAYLLRGIVYHPMWSMGSERGWPDLTMVRVRARRHRLLFAELKSATGVLSARQHQVLNLLRLLAGHWVQVVGDVPYELQIEVHVWRPDDLAQIAEVLA